MKEGWVNKKLWEILVFDKRFNGISKEKQKKVASFVHVSAEKLKELKVDKGSVRLISTGLFDGFTTEELAGIYLNKGEIITIPTGGVANIKYYEGKFVDSGNIIGIAGVKDVKMKYVYYFLLFKKEVVDSFFRGVGIKHPYMPDICEMSIPFPTEKEQENIILQLDLLQAIIDKQQAQLTELDKLAQAVFYDMFGDPVENEKGWERKRLGDLCNTITKGTTPTTLGYSFVSEGINFVKVESFKDGKIDTSKLTHITKECHDALSRSQLDDFDLLVCIAGATIGKTAIVDKSILPANTNQACAIIRLKNKGNLAYIQNCLMSKFKNDVEQMGKGVAQPNLSLGQMRELSIPFPPLSLQQSFAAKIESIEKQKSAISESIAETQKLFDYTMDKYFG